MPTRAVDKEKLKRLANEYNFSFKILGEKLIVIRKENQTFFITSNEKGIHVMHPKGNCPVDDDFESLEDCIKFAICSVDKWIEENDKTFFELQKKYNCRIRAEKISVTTHSTSLYSVKTSENREFWIYMDEPNCKDYWRLFDVKNGYTKNNYSTFEDAVHTACDVA